MIAPIAVKPTLPAVVDKVRPVKAAKADKTKEEKKEERKQKTSVGARVHKLATKPVLSF
jgi:hypothetical protein